MNYAQIEASLKASLRQQDTSFLHGYWHGLFASHNIWTLKEWLDALVDEFSIASMPAALLVSVQQIHDTSLAQLQQDPLSMTLLLPDDTVALRLRAEALQGWTEGYLYGLGQGERIRNWKALPSELREWIEDITQISQLDPASVSDSEEDEVAFTDLSEYVRLAAGHIADTLQQHHTQQQTVH